VIGGGLDSPPPRGRGRVSFGEHDALVVSCRARKDGVQLAGQHAPCASARPAGEEQSGGIVGEPILGGLRHTYHVAA
jgi:hypothetical protein